MIVKGKLIKKLCPSVLKPVYNWSCFMKVLPLLIHSYLLFLSFSYLWIWGILIFKYRAKMADAKNTTSYFLGPTFLGIIMQLSDPWWQYWSEIPKAKLCYVGGMFENKFYWYRFEVCPKIGWNKTFSNIFLNILMPLCRVYIGRPRNVGPRD